MPKYIINDSDGNIVDQLYQWDENRYIEISGINPWTGASVYFNFANVKTTTAFSVMASEVESGVYSAVVPNEILQFPLPITVYVYQTTDENENLTIATIKLPVAVRQMPDDYSYTPSRNVTVIADGLTADDNGYIYLMAGGERFGTGAKVESGGSHSNIPVACTLLTSFPDIAPPERLPECIDTPATVVGETDAMQYTWAQGDIDGTTGQDLNTQDFWWERRIREPDYIPIPPAAGIVRALPLVDGTNESAPKLYFYDSSKNFISCTGFINTYGEARNIPINARFLRIVVGKFMAGGAIPLIVPTDLSACEIEFRLGGS